MSLSQDPCLSLSHLPAILNSQGTLALPADASQCCFDRFGYYPKREQLEIVGLIGQSKDCILIAGCGWGKTLIYFLPLLLWSNCTIVIVTPLKALGEEQHGKLNKLQIPSIALTAETHISLDLLKRLAHGDYIVVFMSPEIIFAGDRLSRLWAMPEWRSHLRAVILDEAHCVSCWGDEFRPHYSCIGSLRSMVPLKTAFVALSATLPPRILSSVIKGVRFQPDVRIINVGNDRPNVKYIVWRLRHAINSYRDLRFVLDFKKTIVYFRTRVDAHRAKDFLHRQLKDPSDSKRIATYHAVKTDKYRRKTMEAFKNGDITILLATEAVGMGCDINNIVRVVQYGAPPNLSSLIQRLGRAARDPNSEGQGILLAPKKVGKKKDAEENDNGKDEDLIKYMTTTNCRREHLNQVFGNKHEVCEKCCDVCHPEPTPDVDIFPGLHDATPTVKKIRRRAPTLPEAEVLIVKSQIEEWRSKIYLRDFEPICDWYTEQCVIADDIVKRLAEMSTLVTGPDSIGALVDWEPPEPEYVQELCQVIINATPTQNIQNNRMSRQMPVQTQSGELSFIQYSPPISEIDPLQPPTLNMPPTTLPLSIYPSTSSTPLLSTPAPAEPIALPASVTSPSVLPSPIVSQSSSTSPSSEPILPSITTKSNSKSPSSLTFRQVQTIDNFFNRKVKPTPRRYNKKAA